MDATERAPWGGHTLHLDSVQVSKELLHGKNLVAVVVWEDGFAGVLVTHVLRLRFAVDAVPPAGVRIQPRPQLVLFAVSSLELRRCRASRAACGLVAFTHDTGGSLQGSGGLAVTADYTAALCCQVQLWTVCTSPSCSWSLCQIRTRGGSDFTHCTKKVITGSFTLRYLDTKSYDFITVQVTNHCWSFHLGAALPLPGLQVVDLTRHLQSNATLFVWLLWVSVSREPAVITPAAPRLLPSNSPVTGTLQKPKTWNKVGWRQFMFTLHV